jgi:hypothetical protein
MLLLRTATLNCTRALSLAGCLAVLLTFAPAAHAVIPNNGKEECVYSAHQVSILEQFDQMIGEQVNCVQVYDNVAPNWQVWESPWFVDYYNEPNYDWSQWATAPGTQRQLIITQNLAPSDVTSQPDWLSEGAAGDFEVYARALAQRLVSAGLGGSVIRLSPEANGTWYADSLGDTPAQWHQWDEFWDNTVSAMRSVPGAHFQFDFNLAALYRNLPLSEIYPGNAYVDIMGVDAYDNGNLGDTAAARWNEVLNGPMGIQEILNFAKAHDKPFSIPEWGVAPVSDHEGFGDDPTFVRGIASVVQNNDVAYQSYFYKYGNATQLQDGPLSLAAYIAAFGPDGYAVGSPAALDAGTRTGDPHGGKPTGGGSKPGPGQPGAKRTGNRERRRAGSRRRHRSSTASHRERKRTHGRGRHTHGRRRHTHGRRRHRHGRRRHTQGRRRHTLRSRQAWNWIWLTGLRRG